NRLKAGERVAYISDAGMPGLNDPGELLLAAAREAGFKTQIIGGVSALTYFIAGLGRDLPSFRFIGFLPPRRKDREALFQNEIAEPTIFMESTHRIESTLEILKTLKPQSEIILAKELSKISENFYSGYPEAVLKKISSFKGEWMGCFLC
ncbi:MAG: rsmI, partial [Bacteriovoracaceae bacterium]|nr:rsmI [Bacteriovoracaceae bacterium]